MATVYTLYSTSATFYNNNYSSSEYPGQAVMEFSVEQDIAANVSNITWALKAGGTNTALSAEWYGYEFSYRPAEARDYINLYGEGVGLSPVIIVKSQQTIATGSFSVEHNIDGTKTLEIYFKGYACEVGFLNGYGSSDIMKTKSSSLSPSVADYVSLELPIIPRTSSITCTTVDIGRNPTITIVKPVSSFKSTIRYEFGSLSGTIVTKTSATTYNSWSIPTSFLNEITNGKYGEGTLYCDTYTSGGTFNGTSSVIFRVNVPSLYGPTLDPTFKDVNSATVALTGDSSKGIQYFSHIQYDTGAYATTGATIKSQRVVCGSDSKSTATGTFYGAESNTFTISATDSRGYTTTETHYITMVPYIKLTSNASLAKVDTSSGYVSLNLRGNFFGGGFGVVDNVTTVSYRYKVDDGAWSDWTDVVYNIYNDEYQATVEFYDLDYKGTYVYQARAVDKLMNVESSEVVVKIMPVFDWGPDDFTFNVPVTIEGDLTVTGTISSLTEQTLGAADFIVDQGTITTGSGNSTANWVYRKWDSGIAECWCRKHVSTAVNTAWGNLYVSGSLSYTNITWGVDFIDIPVANITIAPNASGAFLIAGGSTSLTKDNTGGYEIARGSALASAGNFYINYYGIGKWK